MSQLSPTPATIQSGKKWAWRIALFFIILVIGEWYVKWNPYYHKAFVAAAKHSIGHSIVSGQTDVAPAVSLTAAWHYALHYYDAVWEAVILGVVVGAAVQVLIPRDWLLRALGANKVSSILTAGALAVPGMMCTCCSAPIVVGLRKQQVAVGSALAFWLGNPVLNPATIVFAGFVLGWKFAMIRIVFGLILVLGVGFIANRSAFAQALPDTARTAVADAVQTDSRPLWIRFFSQLGRLSITILPVYILLVLVVGALRSWLFPAIDFGHADGLLWVIGLTLAGTLFVIPTAGEVPIIQTLMQYGLGLGPAYALLLTLPAISAPSMAMVWRHFPKRALLLATSATVVVGLVAGLVGML
ncbi:MAG: permease [Firmicutes bacterium]|nr:permease [Bacillota bacterium]